VLSSVVVGFDIVMSAAFAFGDGIMTDKTQSAPARNILIALLTFIFYFDLFIFGLSPVNICLIYSISVL